MSTPFDPAQRYFEPDELARLAELVAERRYGVARGEICGYGQSETDELADLDKLVAKIQKLAR